MCCSRKTFWFLLSQIFLLGLISNLCVKVLFLIASDQLLHWLNWSSLTQHLAVKFSYFFDVGLFTSRGI